LAWLKEADVQQLLIEILASVESGIATSGFHEIMNESEEDFILAVSKGEFAPPQRLV